MFFLTIALAAVGTLGYIFVSGFPPLDALYMTIITLTTVGFGEIRPLNEDGRIFTMVLILAGAGLIAYNIMYFSQLLMDAHWLTLYRRKKVKKMLKEICNHYIVCGYGQMGRIIAEELVKHGIAVLVIEQQQASDVVLEELGVPHLVGDATEESCLLDAGIERASGLIACVQKDTDNVFIVLTARDLNHDLYICARAGTPGTEKRLVKAGADRVVSPYAVGALRIAQNILRPNVTDFIDLALSGSGVELSLEEIFLPEDATIIGKDLASSRIRTDFNLIVVAIKRADGAMVYNPNPRERLMAGDLLLIVGPRRNLDDFTQRLYGKNCRFSSQCGGAALRRRQF